MSSVNANNSLRAQLSSTNPTAFSFLFAIKAVTPQAARSTICRIQEWGAVGTFVFNADDGSTYVSTDTGNWRPDGTDPQPEWQWWLAHKPTPTSPITWYRKLDSESAWSTDANAVNTGGSDLDFISVLSGNGGAELCNEVYVAKILVRTGNHPLSDFLDETETRSIAHPSGVVYYDPCDALGTFGTNVAPTGPGRFSNATTSGTGTLVVDQPAFPADGGDTLDSFPTEERAFEVALSVGAVGVVAASFATEERAFAVAASSVSIGTPLSAACVMFSGHSLLDQPIADYFAAIATGAGLTVDWQRQHINGSPIAARTKGTGPYPDGFLPWNGYASGANRVGSGLDLVAHFRNVTAVGGKATSAPYSALCICERHDTLNSLEWEATLPYLRHYYDLIRTGSPGCVGYLYSTWLDYDLADLTDWIAYCRATDLANAAIVSRLNATLAYEGRTDVVQIVPAAGMVAEMVERATTLPGLAGITVFAGPDVDVPATMAVLFSDNVHPTDVGKYGLAAMVFGAMYRRDPRGTWFPSGTVNSTQAASLQSVAWDVLVATYGAAPHLGPQYGAEAAQDEIVDYVVPYADFFPGSINVPVYQAYWGGTESVMYFDPPSTEGIWLSLPPTEQFTTTTSFASEERTSFLSLNFVGGLSITPNSFFSEERELPVSLAQTVAVALASYLSEERAFEVSASLGPVAVSLARFDSEERAFSLTLQPAGFFVALGSFPTEERALPIAAIPGAVSVALASFPTEERAFAVGVFSGLLVELNGFGSEERALPLTVNVGTVTLQLPAFASEERGFSLALQVGPVSVQIGGFSSEERAFAVALAFADVLEMQLQSFGSEERDFEVDLTIRSSGVVVISATVTSQEIASARIRGAPLIARNSRRLLG